jgi:hypothetical protein
MDDDWVAHFFDSSRHVSAEEMQSLWARVLAGEANKPGTVSRRSVSLLASLSPQDAALFTSLCSFCTFFGKITPLIYETKGDKADIYAGRGLHFEALTHLDYIGLMYQSLNTLLWCRANDRGITKRPLN